MSIFSFINEELALSGLSIGDINSRRNKDLRQSLVYRAFTRYLSTENDIGKENLIKKIRSETGLKFSNQYGRDTYDSLRQIKRKYTYATKLNNNVLPQRSKLPLIEYDIKGQYLYGISIYIRDKKSGVNKGKKLPKSAYRLDVGKYTYIKDYVFFSEELLTKDQVISTMLEILTGEDNGDSLARSVEGSDYKGVFDDKNSVIGFKYVRAART